MLSVCTGALLLAKAGLLSGLHGTTHHGALAELREDEKTLTIHSAARVVDNGKIVLSAGISAGIDAALYLVGELHGEDQAVETASYIEYDWQCRNVDNESVLRYAQ